MEYDESEREREQITRERRIEKWDGVHGGDAHFRFGFAESAEARRILRGLITASTSVDNFLEIKELVRAAKELLNGGSVLED